MTYLTILNTANEIVLYKFYRKKKFVWYLRRTKKGDKDKEREDYTIPEIIATLLYTNTIHTSQVKNIMYSKIEKGARLFSRHILLCNINLCVIHRYICFGLIASPICYPYRARMHSDLYRIIIMALRLAPPLICHWFVIVT